MAEVVLFGLGEAADVATYYFEHDSEHRVVAHTVDAAYVDREQHRGLPVVPFDELPERFPPEHYTVFLGLGYWRVNAVRAERFVSAKALGYRIASYVSSDASVPRGFRAPEGAFILPGCVVEPFVELGANVTLWSGTTVSHHSSVGDHAFIASQVSLSGGVRVGQRAFIGAGATVSDHVCVGERAVVGAGTVILENVLDDEVWVAPRARKLRRSSAGLLSSAPGPRC